MTFEELIKAYIRGILIAMGAETKKRRRKREVLHKEISELEQQHKKTGVHEIELSAIIKREELKELIEQETRTTFYKIKKERYQWGDKSGKHLARMLKNKSWANFIENIQTGNGEKVYTTSEIVRAFQDYYNKLYSITQKVKERSDNTKAFLKV